MNDATRMADQACYDRAVQHFGERKIALPTFAELAEPQRIGAARVEGLESVGADAAHHLNLFRVHWYNDASRSGLAEVPAHVVLPEALTGVASPIVVALEDKLYVVGGYDYSTGYVFSSEVATTSVDGGVLTFSDAGTHSTPRPSRIARPEPNTSPPSTRAELKMKSVVQVPE